MNLFEMMKAFVENEDEVLVLEKIEIKGQMLVSKEIFYVAEQETFKLNYRNDIDSEDKYSQRDISDAEVAELLLRYFKNKQK